MSWMSKKTGRPKEQGGHHRINISVNEFTYNVLSVADNRSKYIEYCVNECTESKLIAFNEQSETVNDDFTAFKTASSSIWIPNDNAQNAIVTALCNFKYKCSGKSFMIRMKLNGNASSTIEVEGKQDWNWSQVYTLKDLNFGNDVKKNQEGYIIEFQIEPFGESDQAHVKNFTLFLEVVDGL